MSEEHPPTPPPAQPPEEPEQPKTGSMRFQDAESTRPRKPTVAEARARREREAELERQKAARAEAEQKAATRRKVLIGSGVTVGLVGVVATWYLATPSQVEAVCTDESGTIVQDNYCDESYITSQHGYYNPTTGLWVVPLVTGGFGQYRYNYGGTGSVGSHVLGGSYTAPSGNTTVKTKSGATVQRGGFGISGESGSGGS
ncbi:hypothetical protein [Amycolatopsis taiwanensis]|uniref:Tat pathway signal protein n=1 Tax=Amycolatopsis taiwanensis TaxID=342230 RepID=A0A9W6VF08_9PSEU|nr:hypothetical protein [Amycolatopsis taiwanensis]GLY64041.1 hypothetical protein Atai01_06600 [Amycolatopsis taiwanensis]